ncbi:MAG TPA: serine hydrolase domain-containing protein [Bryobacteraceae bacterium]|nr:serine hydrolase domain-containing protein [Bryobacteraceae bacterium]
MHVSRISFCAFALVIAFPIVSGAADSVVAELDRKAAATVDAFGVPSASIAVIQDGKLLWSKAYGYADLANHRKADVSTRYAVGSISKQFTVAAILLEQERGKLSLDDKVAKYFPELTRANEVTIRQLLSHTSGYEDYAPQDYIIPEWTRPTTPREILDRWAKKPLNFDPGTRWQYSNTNYVLAGEILEKISGQKLLPFLKENFFAPLDMSSAGDCEVHSPADATAYTRYALGPPRPVRREARGWYFAAGELCMTPSDLAKWDIAFLEKKILATNSYAEFTHEVKLTDGKGTHYALGLSVSETNGTPSISHSGEVSGFLASNTLFPAKNIGVIVFSDEDGVNLIGALSQQLSSVLLSPPNSETAKREEQIRSILLGLQRGEIDRSLFTENANSYFSDQALSDYRNSLEKLGKLQVLLKQSDQQRGGMAHFTYRAHFENDSVVLNIYILPNGKFEQFLVEEAF